MDNKTRLAVLMAMYRLSADDVAKITGKKRSTVYSWTAKTGRQVPAGVVQQVEQACVGAN